MTLVNSKAKIFGFISFLELSQENISVKKFEQFYWLNKCEVTNRCYLSCYCGALKNNNKQFQLQIF